MDSSTGEDRQICLSCSFFVPHSGGNRGARVPRAPRRMLAERHRRHAAVMRPREDQGVLELAGRLLPLLEGGVRLAVATAVDVLGSSPHGPGTSMVLTRGA